MTRLDFCGLVPCECTDHAYVRLRRAGGHEPVDVKVEISLAHAILAELSGIPSQCSALVDILAGTLRALEMEIVALTLHGLSSDHPVARLHLGDPERQRVLQVPAGPGLLVASRLRCLVQQAPDPELFPPAGPEPPELFREFLASLDLTELDGGGR